MQKEPRVMDIIKAYSEGSLLKVYQYLTQEDMIVNPDTWAGNIKKKIENKQFITAIEEIELISYKFIKLKN